MRKRLKEGFFSFLIRMKERMGNQLGILPNTRLEVAHLIKKCAQTLALSEILLVF
jgi:hypothetical protein